MRRPASPAGRAPAGELLATAVTLATLAGGVRLFDGTSFLAPVLGAALLAHLLVALMRRAGRGVALSALVSLVGVAALQVWVHYPQTTGYGLPRRATFEAIGADLGDIWQLLQSSQVPLGEDTGLLVAAAAVAWLLALLSDWAAFRVGARGEALAPAAILLALVATFGPPTARSSTPRSAWRAPSPSPWRTPRRVRRPGPPSAPPRSPGCACLGES